jgi:molybdopterin-guanine dinucleotide biosynthesis protein A
MFVCENINRISCKDLKKQNTLLDSTFSGDKPKLTTSAIVLAGGSSSRFGEDKGMVTLAGKPLINHIVDAIRRLVDETIVVTSSSERIAKYEEIISNSVKFVEDIRESNGPLIGALTGFAVASGKYAIILPFDTPFVSREVVSLLFELCIDKSAVIPRWPNGQIEPLHAIYQVQLATAAAEAAVAEGRLDMLGMIERLDGVRFVSTIALQEFDPELKFFFNINTPLDLKRAADMIKHRKL